MFDPAGIKGVETVIRFYGYLTSPRSEDLIFRGGWNTNQSLPNLTFLLNPPIYLLFDALQQLQIETPRVDPDHLMHLPVDDQSAPRGIE